MTGPAVSLRQLNRWTLDRQLLLERAELDAVTAVERLAGMQAQYSPSPYIGLWSRLRGFRREELEAAMMESVVVKATLMRGTLHLVSGREFDRYRVASRHPNAHAARVMRLLAEVGADPELIREEILGLVRERPRSRAELVRERPRSRAELVRALAHRVPDGMPGWLAFGAVHLTGATMNVPEDARFGHHGGSRYRLAPPAAVDLDSAQRSVIAAYLRAFGPASRADIAQWLGQPASAFAAALASLDTVVFRAEDGRLLLDLPDAPRPGPDTPAPVRFLPKWDNLLLAYERRERVLPEHVRRTVIRRNGDVIPTFMVDGVVAGAWEASQRGPAAMTLTPFGPLPARSRRDVEHEAEALLAWLRPDASARTVRWAPA